MPLCCVTQVQEAVHGVTIEECKAALQNHNWNIQNAVHYLKVRASICKVMERLMHRGHLLNTMLVIAGFSNSNNNHNYLKCSSHGVIRHVKVINDYIDLPFLEQSISSGRTCSKTQLTTLLTSADPKSAHRSRRGCLLPPYIQ